LDERSRELYWEGFRRTDLVRFNQFTTGTYVWPFKGGINGGTAVSDFRNLYPIPANVISVNPNLVQNTGY
jgi:sugar lactone lactonase YvrE